MSALMLPVAWSQIRAVLSPLAVASQVPSGATATALTGPVWPVRTARHWPVARSQLGRHDASQERAVRKAEDFLAEKLRKLLWPVAAPKRQMTLIRS